MTEEERRKANLLHWTKHWKPYKKVFKENEELPDLSDEDKSILWLENQKKERREWLKWRKEMGFPEKYGD